MFCNKAANKMVVSTHHRALSAVQMVFSQSYEELLVLNKAETIHKKKPSPSSNIEVYKSVSRLNPEFMWEYFVNKDINYSLRLGMSLLLLRLRKLPVPTTWFLELAKAWNKRY